MCVLTYSICFSSFWFTLLSITGFSRHSGFQLCTCAFVVFCCHKQCWNEWGPLSDLTKCPHLSSFLWYICLLLDAAWTQKPSVSPVILDDSRLYLWDPGEHTSCAELLHHGIPQVKASGPALLTIPSFIPQTCMVSLLWIFLVPVTSLFITEQNHGAYILLSSLTVKVKIITLSCWRKTRAGK